MIGIHHKQARELLATAEVGDCDKKTQVLKEIGTALHPLQDIYSHNAGHTAATPFDHAPRYYCCLLYSDCLGLTVPACKNARLTNPNWKDGHRPDNVQLWDADYLATEAATKADLRSWMAHPLIQCWCARGKGEQ